MQMSLEKIQTSVFWLNFVFQCFVLLCVTFFYTIWSSKNLTHFQPKTNLNNKKWEECAKWDNNYAHIIVVVEKMDGTERGYRG